MEQTSISEHNGDRAISSKVNLLILAFILASILCNVFIHIYDNKFTHNGEVQPVLGIFYLNTEDLCDKVYYIGKEWELYEGIVNPMETGEPDRYVNIGQYAGFEFEDEKGNPYGSVTYKMQMILPEKEERYMLELPEIFSAYRLFIDGEQVFQCGNPDSESYEPGIIQSKITFSAAGETEILLQVSNFSYYYSGMVYPPAFGNEQNMGKMMAARTIMKSIQCFLAVLMLFYYLAVFFTSGRDRRMLYFSMVCLGYLAYAAYFLVHTFVETKSFLWYRMENFFFMFMLLFLCELVCTLWGEYRNGITKKLIRLVGVLSMALVLILPGFVGGNLKLMLIYGEAVEVYKLAVVIYLVIMCSGMMAKGMTYSKSIVFTLIFFGVSLFFDTFHRNYEPVLLGWGGEYAGFLLLLVLAVMIVKDRIELEQSNKALVAGEINKSKYFEELVHDLKAPLATITTYAELTRMGIAKQAGKEEQYLTEIEERAMELAGRIQKIKKLDYKELENLECHPVESIAYLETVAEKYRVMLAHKGISIHIEGESFLLHIDEKKMDVALENLIMNSTEFTPSGGSITLIAEKKGNLRELSVCDTGVGVNVKYLNTIFNRGITYSEDVKDRTEHGGLGLYIVSKIVAAHKGSVRVESEEGQGSKFILEFKENL